MATPVPSPDLAYGVERRRHDKFNLELTSVRVHAVALARWFNANFEVTAGYPIPVIHATPMDAFSKFNLLWSSANNPFAYLNEINSPHVDPANPRFPLINVSFQGMQLRPEQNYGSRTFRRIDWRSVSDESQGLTINDLGYVTQARYPQAWNYQYQVDFWCLRPDTQAIFIDQLTSRFKFGGGTAQAFISVVYPGYIGWVTCRSFLDGGAIRDATEKDPGESVLKFRTTFNLTVEGWKPDLDVSYVPTLWYEVFGNAATTAANLAAYYDMHSNTRYAVDLRASGVNPVVVSRRATMPANGTIADSLNVPTPPAKAEQLSSAYLAAGDGSLRPNPTAPS